ncbi:transposase [Staphylococcus sp. 17KM0847]|nr:transposase [Staphylococcus sp. 17KM0847]
MPTYHSINNKIKLIKRVSYGYRNVKRFNFLKI